MRFVQRLALGLLVLCAVAAAAMAGPNAGGVLVVHSSTVAYTTDTATYIGQSGVACGQDELEHQGNCPPYNPVVGPCDELATNPTSTKPADTPQVWYVLAAFPDSSCPRLKAIGFGFQYNERYAANLNGKLVIIGFGSADPIDSNLVFELTQASREDSRPFPATGSSVALSFTYIRTSHLQELYWFAGYAYSDGTGDATFNIIGHEFPANNYFVDDAQPGNLDPINGYGTLGFNGTTGSNPTPVLGYACCINQICSVRTLAECTAAGGHTNGNYYCDPLVGDDIECLGSPVEETTWGRVKHDYSR